MNSDYLIYSIAAIVGFLVVRKVIIRLRLSRAKHPSIRGHAKWSRRIAALIRTFDYDEDRYYCSDGAPENVASRRRDAMMQLGNRLSQNSSKSIEFGASLEDSISDVRFTSAYRVPFPYRKLLAEEFKLGSIVEATDGVQVRDIDGTWRYDLTGSYGVNVFGYDFYKDCMAKGFEKVKDLGPVLGPYHPLIRENVEKLKIVSGLDEVSFHMSGTEAVMQAVRLARYHTKKTHLVQFCGAYHGWWDGVQPGVGNQRKVNDVYTLNDMSEDTVRVLETRNDIACILINPLQALHPNSNSASDVSLIASDRSAHFDRVTYTKWLKQLREICTRRNIVLIFDEVFTGFRLGHRGAQEYFGVQADMVTYGKTLGGGLPIGVVCGKHALMKRFKDEQPANVSFARGTFNSHPYVIGAMNEFLHRIEAEEIQEMYHGVDTLWTTRVEQINLLLKQNDLPIEFANMHSVLTVLYTLPSRYNWMFQFYLRAEGLELSWIGSGRMIMSFNFTDEDFNEVSRRIILAAQNMKRDGWWWQTSGLSNKSIKRLMLRDLLAARFPFLRRNTKHGAGRKTNAIEPVVSAQ
ncbi:MAG: glutamate-1-semialdehyde 2,1-aminomutase [Rhodospirillaceae bacterium]|nr:glutamate-1-semialdehyde 2,1-aminomutase [Rhodospirillaceae bacterium]OUT76932.1 MAG: glutamate-1-semialdehyde 2,1-aminomutase [Rhodospirillaceae bacterium TMED23]|tara:strand:- start:3048 stop:4772 length:1725 start_codon:yes stop_codon:yes gene_type:complete